MNSKIGLAKRNYLRLPSFRRRGRINNRRRKHPIPHILRSDWSNLPQCHPVSEVSEPVNKHHSTISSRRPPPPRLISHLLLTKSMSVSRPVLVRLHHHGVQTDVASSLSISPRLVEQAHPTRRPTHHLPLLLSLRLHLHPLSSLLTPPLPPRLRPRPRQQQQALVLLRRP
jgi:hypothetical protein